MGSLWKKRTHLRRDGMDAEERRVAYEALPWFEDLQKNKHRRKRSGEEQETWKDVLEYSRSIGNILGRVDDPVTPEDAQRGAIEDTFLYRRSVWEMVEMIYVDRSFTHGCIAEGIVQWLQRNTILLQSGNNPAGTELGRLVSLLRSDPLPEVHPEYWSCLQRLTALGWTTLVVEVLGKHSAWTKWKHGDPRSRSQVSVLEPVTLLLRTMPRYKVSSLINIMGRSFDSVEELMHFRKGWLDQCQQLIASHDLWAECGGETAVGLLKILAILAGDEETIQSSTHSWLELFVAMLLHIYPNLKAFGELKALADSCMSIKGGGEGELDRMLVAILERDTQELVNLCSNFLGPWMMAHLTELLSAPAAASAPLSSAELPGFGSTQAEYYRLFFSMNMASDMRMWKVVVGYLAWCPVHGAKATEALFQRLPFHRSDWRTIQQVLFCCDKLGLRVTADDICKRAGSFAWQEGHIGTAIYWFQRAGDESRLLCIGRKLLDRVSGGKEGQTIDQHEFSKLAMVLDLLETSGNVPPGDLAFMVGYRRLSQTLKEWKELKLAIGGAQDARESETLSSQLNVRCLAIRDGVLDLINGGKAPKRFWPFILFQAIPAMESRELVFDTKDTQLLVNCMEALTPETVLSRSRAVQMDDGTRLMKGAVRLALMRNMARAHASSLSGF